MTALEILAYDRVNASVPFTFSCNYLVRQNLFLDTMYIYGVVVQGKSTTVREHTARTSSNRQPQCHSGPVDIRVWFWISTNNAVGTVFGDHVLVQGCFYYLCQSTRAGPCSRVHFEGRCEALHWHAGWPGITASGWRRRRHAVHC